MLARLQDVPRYDRGDHHCTITISVATLIGGLFAALVMCCRHRATTARSIWATAFGDFGEHGLVRLDISE